MTDKENIKVAVGLSGGVDSSVTASLLKRQGYDVVGLSMVIYDESIKIDHSGGHACYGPDEENDISSAEAACKKLGIPFHVIDLKKEFNEFVIKYFRSEYLKGSTPNPCIVCNRRLKFGFMLEKAREAGIVFDKFATGHYAKIERSKDRYLLKRPVDRGKDQTYFLYSLSQEQLSKTIFPLGDYHKKEVRDIARSIELNTSERPESQDFISGGDYSPFFRAGEVRKGDIVNDRGEVLGRHRGIIHYTVGQRKGLGISSPAPLYVSEIDAENNRIVVKSRSDLYSRGLTAGDLNFISVDGIDKPVRISAKIRLQHKGASGLLSMNKAGRAELIFDQPQLAVTQGQSVVFYYGDIVMGGGVIERAIM